MCCKLLEVAEINKPLNEWCQHCEVAVGCRIYQDRPQSCRNFNCLYITHTLKFGLRPDQCHVVFEKLPGYKIILATVDPAYPKAIDGKLVKTLIFQILRDGYSVVISTKPGQTKHMLLAEGATQDKVWADLTQAYQSMRMKSN